MYLRRRRPPSQATERGREDDFRTLSSSADPPHAPPIAALMITPWALAAALWVMLATSVPTHQTSSPRYDVGVELLFDGKGFRVGMPSSSQPANFVNNNSEMNEGSTALPERSFDGLPWVNGRATRGLPCWMCVARGAPHFGAVGGRGLAQLRPHSEQHDRASNGVGIPA
jgi:hypothetical protein